MQNLVVANEYGSNIEVYWPDNSGEISIQDLNAFFKNTGLTLDQLTSKAPIQNLKVDTWNWVRKCTCSISGTCRRVVGVRSGSLSDLETIITSVAMPSYILVSKNCINYTTWTLWTNQSLAPLFVSDSYFYLINSLPCVRVYNYPHM